MAGQAGRHIGPHRAARGDGAAAPQGGTRWRVSHLRLPRQVMAPALGAGITAAVLAGAMVAADPRPRPRRPAARRPSLGNPAGRWLAPWERARATGSKSMSAQARTAATASSPGFSGAYLDGVSCTGRKQCTATGMASTRNGKNLKPLAERWNGTTLGQADHPHHQLRRPAGWHAHGGVSCTSSTACMAAGYSYSPRAVQLLGEGWNGRTWSIQPDSTPA